MIVRLAACRGRDCRAARTASSGVRPRTMSKWAVELADLRAGQRLEIGQDQLAVEQVAGRRRRCRRARCPGWPAIMIWVVSSSRPPRFTLTWMCGAGRPGIRDRLDRPEVVLAVRAGREPAEALEVLVLLIAGRAAVAGVQVHLVGVALPDLDGRIPHGAPGRAQDAAGQVRDLADGRGDVIVDDDQVVVGIERQLVRVERPFRQGRACGGAASANSPRVVKNAAPRAPRKMRRPRVSVEFGMTRVPSLLRMADRPAGGSITAGSLRERNARAGRPETGHAEYRGRCAAPSSAIPAEEHGTALESSSLTRTYLRPTWDARRARPAIAVRPGRGAGRPMFTDATIRTLLPENLRCNWERPSCGSWAAVTAAFAPAGPGAPGK